VWINYVISLCISMQILFNVTFLWLDNHCNWLISSLKSGDFSSVLGIIIHPVLQRRRVINGYARVFCFPIAFQGLLLPISTAAFACLSQKSSCSWKSIEAPGSSKVDHFRSLLPSFQSRARSICATSDYFAPNKASTRYLLVRMSEIPVISRNIQFFHCICFLNLRT